MVSVKWLSQTHVFENWSPVSGTVWEGLRGVALLEEVCRHQE